MDFHSLSRKELQTLCKKNKIPANITNVAMADALEALQFVEGIEEFSNPSESVTGQSSIESPEKMEVTSPCVPRTGGRTTRRKIVKDESENSRTLTRTRRSTRKLVETPAATNNRKVPVSSVRRKMDSQLEEVEEEKIIGSKDVSETPSVLPSSRRRGRPKLTSENTVTRTYSTRRSARLSEKNANEKIETVKGGELFSEESGENVEIPESCNDLGEVIETTDIDLKKESEGDLERKNVKEFNSVKKSDDSSEDQIQFASNESLVPRAVDDLKTEVPSEILDEKDPSADTSDDPLEVLDEVHEQSGDDVNLNKAEDELENGANLDVNQETVSENLVAGTVEKVVLAQDDAFNIDDKAQEVDEEKTDLTEGANSRSPDDNQTVIEEVLENVNVENDEGFQTMAADNVEVNKCSEEFAALDINGGAITEEDEITVAEESLVILPKAEEECVDNNMMKETTAQELNASDDLVPELTASDDKKIAKSCDFVGSLEEEECVDNNLVEETETTAMELNASGDAAAPKKTYEAATNSEKSPVKHSGILEEASADVPLFTVPAADDHNDVPTCLTPLSKKSASKTTSPLKKSASKKTPATNKKLSHLFDDKENIDKSGSKLILLTKEKKKIKDSGLSTSTQYIDVSLRKLKKELKEKLETGKNLKKDEQVSSRPALQAVSENIVVEKNNNNNPQDI